MCMCVCVYAELRIAYICNNTLSLHWIHSFQMMAAKNSYSYTIINGSH